MRIKQILSQSRRDFHAIYVCPFCGCEVEDYGYDDDNFHQNVIPKKKCPNCGKTELDGEKNYRPLQTKYKAYEEV